MGYVAISIPYIVIAYFCYNSHEPPKSKPRKSARLLHPGLTVTHKPGEALPVLTVRVAGPRPPLTKADDSMSSDPVLPERGGAALYHPTNGLNYRLLIDGKLYVYDPYLDGWVNSVWTDDVLSGEEIHRRVAEAPVRLEVAP